MREYLDVYIAAALLLAVIGVFVASRVGVVPKKSIPYIVGALGAVFGLHVFRRWQGRAIDEQIRELEAGIAKRDEELARLEKDRAASRRELDAVRASLDQQLAASQKQRLLIEAQNTTERERIDRLDLPSTLREYKRMQDAEAARAATPSGATGP